ncbi:MAG: 2,3-bisphosphoglycerate-independent phosphoglycerate mutase [Patescibacteria group bacterium]|nr:2,3-bisphosphoglycerate-independent phosphoglycerate mutase [Patescibacteria group bacterium]
MDNSEIKKPITLVVLDGWGQWNQKQGNAIAQASLPTIDKLDKYYPKLLLQASGMSVGLPWGVFGNSEVGHQTMGSGQIIYQYNPIITASIENGTFFQNEILLNAMEHVKKNKSSLHLMGLVSDGGVHSHIDHLTALIEIAAEQKVKHFYLHIITDGRDTAPKDAKKFVEEIIEKLSKIDGGKIATIAGRYYTMDRSNNWDRIQKSFNAMVDGQGIEERDPIEAIDRQYDRELTDEYIEPIVMVGTDGKPTGKIKDNDAIIFFNFRKDRARQISRAFTSNGIEGLDQDSLPKDLKFVCFTKYENDLQADIVFPPQKITTRLGEIISKAGKTQLRIAETEKYAHVTYFFNGGVEKPYQGEDRIVVLSKNVSSYADVPEMSAQEVTDKLTEAIDNNEYDFVLVNYANPDMVGHTGNFDAGVKAVEFVDGCLDKLIKTVLKKNGCLLITADHGNVEEMVNLRTGEKDTEHSINPVPCWFITAENHRERARSKDPKTNIEGMLVDIAPTILQLMNLPEPEDMTGQSLFESFEEK